MTSDRKRSLEKIYTITKKMKMYMLFIKLFEMVKVARLNFAIKNKKRLLQKALKKNTQSKYNTERKF